MLSRQLYLTHLFGKYIISLSYLFNSSSTQLQLSQSQHNKYIPQLLTNPNFTMQFPMLAFLAVAATTVFAQDLTGLPTCAQACFTDNFANSACADTDIACLCADSVFFGDVEICVLTDCSTDDAVCKFKFEIFSWREG